MVKVGLARAPGYEPGLLDRTLESIAEYTGFPDVRGASVLVKPNLLKAAPPEAAVTTHPEFVAAAIRFLKNRGAGRILAGDSPAWQPGLSCAKTSGILAALRSEGAEWVDFVPGKPRVSNSPASGSKGMILASVLEDCDLVLNLPKLKTHRLLAYTGAVKNLFGLVPGLAKSGLHLSNPSRSNFGRMIAELPSMVGPVYTFMDGIVGMEGEGPGSGDPRLCSLVLGSHNPSALDWIASSCIGYDPLKIPYLVLALEKSGHEPTEIEAGPLSPAETAVGGFRLLPYPNEGGQARIGSHIPRIVSPLFKALTVDRPRFSAKKCSGCSACVKICPAGALELSRTADNRHQVLIDDSACILCFCCHEVCPSGAVSVGKVPIRQRSEKRTSGGLR